MQRDPTRPSAILAVLRTPGAAIYPISGAAAVIGTVSVVFYLSGPLFDRTVSAFGIEAVLGSILFYGGGLTVGAAYIVFGLIAVYVVWIPFKMALAYAIGTTLRGDRATRLETARAVVDRRRLLFRWAILTALVSGVTAQFFPGLARKARSIVLRSDPGRGVVTYVPLVIALENPRDLDRAVEIAETRLRTAQRTPTGSYTILAGFVTVVVSITATVIFLVRTAEDGSTWDGWATIVSMTWLPLFGALLTAMGLVVVRTRDYVDGEDADADRY